MKGFLFIGDPHVTSVKPGRRKDDFVTSVLTKLAVAAEVARREDLLPVILGDLFHRPRENHLPTLSRLIDVLKQFHVTPVCLGGNHDKAETQLTETDALQLLDQIGVLRVYDGECREAEIFDTPAGRLALWVAPYGAKLPISIEASAEQVILITHHDLAFEGAYPGAAELYEIRGCDLVVNGHMHKTTPSVRKGQTHWHCPGNIEPLSVDCIDHVPAVWAWVGESSSELLQKIVLPHERDCFDMTGVAVAPASTSEALADLAVAPVTSGAQGLADSEFAELISAQTTLETARTEDDQTFREDLKVGMTELNVCGPVQALLLALVDKQEPIIVEVLPSEEEEEDLATA